MSGEGVGDNGVTHIARPAKKQSQKSHAKKTKKGGRSRKDDEKEYK
jgi:hypothetical protein